MNAPLYLIAAHRKTERIDTVNPARNLSNNRFNIGSFEEVTVEKSFAEIDGIRYPTDPINNYYTEKIYTSQYRDLKLFYSFYVGQQQSL